jgi:hypothetical protein
LVSLQLQIVVFFSCSTRYLSGVSTLQMPD